MLLIKKKILKKNLAYCKIYARFFIEKVKKMANIIDGKLLASKIMKKLKEEVNSLKQEEICPKLAVIMVGNDKASEVYVRNKSKACNEVGIEFEEFILKEDITMQQLLAIIEKLNNRKDIHGILLQSPIPKHLDIRKAFNTINCQKDVDGFNPINIGKLMIGEDTFISCTPYGVIKMLEDNNIKIEGKNAVVIGRSNIVGKPLAQCLLNKDATVTVCHSKTQNLEEITRQADILLVAIGKPEFVTAKMVKEGATVIDIGINRNEEGKLVGDVKFDEVSQKVQYISPVPGGVGPMTIAMLLNNVIKAAKQQNIEIEENSKYYILKKEDLTTMGLSNINIEPNEYYIVNYDNMEVLYTKGIKVGDNEYYKLSDFNNLSDEKEIVKEDEK